MNVLFIHGMDVECAKYNVRHYRKHEILLLDTFLLYIYFTPNCVWKYLGSYNNNVTHIYIVIVHDFYGHRYTLLPCPCLQSYCKYGTHDIIQNCYSFQRNDLIFRQTLCFARCEFYLWGVSDKNHTILTGNSSCFFQICNTHNRT